MYICRQSDIGLNELPNHDYDYIPAVQLKSNTGNPPTTKKKVSEVKFEVTPCEAYGPVSADESNYY